MLEVKLEREITFNLPEGAYAASISGIKSFVKQSGRGKQDWVRLSFDVTVPGMENLDCRAGRNFLLNFKAGSDIRNFLTPVLGEEFFKKNSAKSIDLEKTLVGLHGVVHLSHFSGEDFDTPLVVVDAFEPVTEAGKD